MTYAELKNEVRRLSSQISLEKAGEFVNDAYRKFLNLRNWWFLNKTTTFNTEAPRSGTATVESGSSTVTCSFTVYSSDVGKYFSTGDLIPIRIINVDTENNRITLQTPYTGTSGDVSCEILTLRYTLPSDCERLLGVDTPYNALAKVGMGYLNRVDPRRKQRGIPQCFAEAEQIGAKNREIELWPIPNSNQTFRMVYKRSIPPLTNNNDEPICFPHIVALGAQVEAATFLFSYTGDQAYQITRQNLLEELQAQLAEVIKEDKRIRGSLDVVIGPFDIMSPNDPIVMKQIIWMQRWW